jgi:hypothetical protein
MNLCMVIEVIQNNTPESSIVIIPGTHPNTLNVLQSALKFSIDQLRTYDKDHDCDIIARHTWSPANNQAAFCHDIVLSLISCLWSSTTSAVMASMVLVPSESCVSSNLGFLSSDSRLCDMAATITTTTTVFCV